MLLAQLVQQVLLAQQELQERQVQTQMLLAQLVLPVLPVKLDQLVRQVTPVQQVQQA
jgi:hypothetical protein